MPDYNKANRQVCDVDIRILKTMAPFLKFDTANTTTAGLTSDNVYAMAKGSRRIAFNNPVEGSMTIEAQVYPFKFFSLMSNGVIETTAAYAETKTITAEEEGRLSIDIGSGKEVKVGTVFVYPEGEFGEDGSAIQGVFVSGVFTATTSGDIVVGLKYEVGYIVTRSTGVKRVSFNNRDLPSDYYITMTTVDKDEQGLFTPFLMTAYKATIQRNFELTFSSEGDPASVSLTFDLSEDKDGNVFDMVELTDDAV